MIPPRKRLRGPRLAVQLVVTWSCVSALGAGCSSDTKTVTVDCPLGGASSSAGHPSTPTAGNQSSAGGSGGVEVAQAGEAGIPGAEAGAAQGGSLGGSGGAGTSGGASGGHAGAAGRGGSAGVGGHAGNSASGGHGGLSGSTGTGGSGASSGGKAAVCGDKAVSSPEFCDDGTNTDLSYGCYACTTLPADRAPQGAQQCDACLSHTPTKDCFACQDHRACYACLRQQARSFDDGDYNYCGNGSDDDVTDDPSTHQKFSDECFNPNDPIGSAQIGGPAGPATRRSVCQALVACVLRTGCARGTYPISKQPRTLFGGCYEGDDLDFTMPGFVAAGPCASEYRDASAVPAGYNSVAEAQYIGANFIDADPTQPWFVLGVAYYMLGCAANGCASVCYPNGTGSGGTGSGGSGGIAGHSGGGS